MNSSCSYYTVLNKEKWIKKEIETELLFIVVAPRERRVWGSFGSPLFYVRFEGCFYSRLVRFKASIKEGREEEDEISAWKRTSVFFTPQPPFSSLSLIVLISTEINV